MKKMWKVILGIGAAIIGIAALLGSNKKTPKKVLKNNKKIDELETKLVKLKDDKQKAVKKVETLKTKVDGRSKKIKDAKKKSAAVDASIEDLEKQLADIDKALGK